MDVNEKKNVQTSYAVMDPKKVLNPTPNCFKKSHDNKQKNCGYE